MNDNLQALVTNWNGQHFLFHNFRFYNLDDLMEGAQMAYGPAVINESGMIAGTVTREDRTFVALMLPVELETSHRELVGVGAPQYYVNADSHEVDVIAAILPSADGTEVEWQLEGIGGNLSEDISEAVDGFTETKLTTSTAAGSAYVVKAQVKKLIYPTGEEDEATEFNLEEIGYENITGLKENTAILTVIPGFTGQISVTREAVLEGGPTSSLLADGKSQVRIVAALKDQFGQPVMEGTPVKWHLGGLGRLAIIDRFTDAGGLARAVVTAGEAAGAQKLRIEADAYEVTETITNTTPNLVLLASDNSLNTTTKETASLLLSAPGVADGAIVTWHTTRGDIINASSIVQDESASATLLAVDGDVGTGLVVAFVGGAYQGTQVEFTSSSPFQVQVTNPVIAGDASSDGTMSVPKVDGGSENVAYKTSTDVLISAPSYAGQNVQVSLGRFRPTELARLGMNSIVSGQILDPIGGHHADVDAATLDTTTMQEGAASLHFNGQASLEIADHSVLRLSGGIRLSAWVRTSSAGGATLVEKEGEYRLFIDETGHVAFTAYTSEGPFTVTGGVIPADQWSQATSEYLPAGEIHVTLNSATKSLSTGGVASSGTSSIVIGEGLAGNLDNFVISRGKTFIAGTGLTVTGLDPSGEVTLDSSGEARNCR